MAIANLKEELQELTQIFFFKKTKAGGGTGSGSEDEFRDLMNEETQLFTIKSKDLQDEITALTAKVQEIETADPGSRLYSKGAKLVASGATIEDIMQECALPRAEAELLVSLHRKSDS